MVLCVATSGRILQPQIDYAESKPKKRKIQIGDSWYEVPITFKKLDLQDLVDIERQEEIKDLTVLGELIHLKLEQGYYLVPNNATGKNLYDSLYYSL